MFKSKKNIDSAHLNNTTLPLVNDSYNGVPKITSTPLNPRHVQLSRRSSVFLSPTKSRITTPRRYSLSETNSPVNKSNSKLQEAHSSGPLLASLNYKDNVSMYEETKSSGLARRIVLYNEEVEAERPPTHQEKYHSPGLFPIVHLFKQKPPLLEQSPKRVKIKLSSPDYLRSPSPQQRSKLLEGLAQSKLQHQHSSPTFSQNTNDSGTKSVLDALKEISRKRIHSNEDCDPNGDTGKRLRTELPNGNTLSGKRNRADSPQFDTADSPPPKQSQKKFCVYDEFAASKSSTDFSFLSKLEPTKSKRKTISTSTESLKESKQVKLINAETQTVCTNNERNNEERAEPADNESNSQKNKKKESPLKVFDDAPLDRIRKNRLAALMGNLAGKDAAILPKPSNMSNISNKSNELDTTDTAARVKEPEKPKESESDSSNKPLISILSPPKTKELSPVKSDKHVHFSLPATTLPSNFSQSPLTQTSASIVFPIVSASVSSSSSSGRTEQDTAISNSITTAESKKSTTTSSTPSFSFGNPGLSKSDILTSNLAGESGITTTPSIIFSSTLQNSKEDIASNMNTPKATSPSKLGGFKFDLKTTSSNDLVSTSKQENTVPTFSHSSLGHNTNSTSTTSSTSSSFTTFTLVTPNEPKKDSTFKLEVTAVSTGATSTPTFSFGGDKSKMQPEVKLPSFSFSAPGNSNTSFSTYNPNTSATRTDPSAIITSSSNNLVTLPSFSFAPSTPATTTSAVFAFGGSKTVTSSSGFDIKSTPAFGSNSTSVTQSTLFGNSSGVAFGNNSTNTTSVFSGTLSTSTSGFGTTPVSATQVFGTIPTTSASVFGTTPITTTPSFNSIPVTSTSGFGNATAISPPAFGNTPALSMPVFGGASVSSTQTFGNTSATTTPTFGNTTTSTPLFGNTAVTSTPVFGNTNTSTTSGFGVTNPTTSSIFGSSNTPFGSNPTTTAPAFGSSNVNTSAFGSANVFGSTNTQAPSFGNNTTPAFGTSSQTKPLFGASTNTSNAPPAFGTNTFGTGGATSATTSAPTFGTANPTPTFSFGSNKPSTNVFGSVTTTTTSSSTFGNNTFSSNSGFGSNSGFVNNAAPTFGSSTPSNAFGLTSTPAFGQTENKAAFTFGTSNENKPNPVFGSGASNSAFGKPINNQNTFGNSSGGFGTQASSFNTQQTNGGFNFGSNTSSSVPAPFTFGANTGSAEVPKPTFNFTGGSNPPAFGSNASAPAFGASNTSFGVPAPTFGAAGAPAAGVFNIGAGTNPGRPRTQLRAKRRT